MTEKLRHKRKQRKMYKHSNVDWKLLIVNCKFPNERRALWVRK